MNALADYTATKDAAYLKGETISPIFSEFEDPDYAAFFNRAASLVAEFESGAISAGDAARRIFELTHEYDFVVPMRADAMRRARWLPAGEEISARNLEIAGRGVRWALTNPTSRDLFGTASNFYRWRARQSDPHLAGHR